MKRLIHISFASVVLVTAGFAQSTNTWLEQWHKAKFGRYSAPTEARLNAEQAGTAFRQQTAADEVRRTEALPAISWTEQWHKAKYGRYSARYEAHQKAEQTETAFREEPRAQPAPSATATRTTNSWLEQWYKAKYGRYSPMEEARRRAEGK